MQVPVKQHAQDVLDVDVQVDESLFLYQNTGCAFRILVHFGVNTVASRYPRLSSILVQRRTLGSG
jgi:hypothetical protein